MDVNHSELIEVLDKAYDVKVPVDVKGKPGIGKSEVVMQFARQKAKELGKEFVFWNEHDNKEITLLHANDLSKYFIFADLRLSQFDQTDLKGFPVTKAEYAKWVPTLLFKVLSMKSACGIVFFDEMNLSTPSVMASALQIVNDHMICETPISKDVCIISAGNNIEDSNNVFEESAPLNNRRINVTLLPPSAVAWTEWALKNDIDSRIISFINWRESNLFRYEANNADPSFPSPRTWELASDMINDVEVNDVEDERLLRKFVGGCVGEGTAREFISFLKLKSKVNVKDILKNPKLMKEIKEIDLKYAIVSELAEIYRKDGRLEEILAVCSCLQPEFAMFTLKLMKAYSKDFYKELVKSKNWKYLANDFAKYMM